jgi:hypothetical protein
MSEPNRPTAAHCELLDVDDHPPSSGQVILALGLGGKLVETVWTSKSHEFFYAWMPYPKVPLTVKKKLYERYMQSASATEVLPSSLRCTSISV